MHEGKDRQGGTARQAKRLQVADFSSFFNLPLSGFSPAAPGERETLEMAVAVG
jgi:hypothetical protein